MLNLLPYAYISREACSKNVKYDIHWCVRYEIILKPIHRQVRDNISDK